MFGAAAQTVGHNLIGIQINIKDGIIIHAEALDDLQPLQMLGFLSLPLFRGVSDKYIENIAEGLASDKMSVVFDPPDISVFLNNAVFHIIQVMLTAGNLLPYALLHFLKIIRVYDSAKGVAGQHAEFFRRVAAKDTEEGLIRVDDLLFFFRVIDEEASRHLVHELFYFIGHLHLRRRRRQESIGTGMDGTIAGGIQCG